MECRRHLLPSRCGVLLLAGLLGFGAVSSSSADPIDFRATVDILEVTTNLTGWDIFGSVFDTTPAFCDAEDVKTNHLLFCEARGPDVDKYRVTTIGSVSPTLINFGVEYIGTNGAPTSGQPSFGHGHICADIGGTNGVGVPPSDDQGSITPLLKRGVEADIAKTLAREILNVSTGATGDLVVHEALSVHTNFSGTDISAAGGLTNASGLSSVLSTSDDAGGLNITNIQKIAFSGEGGPLANGLFDSTLTNIAVDVTYRSLISYEGNLSLDWENRTLNDMYGEAVMQWDNPADVALLGAWYATNLHLSGLSSVPATNVTDLGDLSLSNAATVKLPTGAGTWLEDGDTLATGLYEIGRAHD